MDGVFLAGLLSFDTASAHPAPPATASGVGFLELARGITPADGVAGRSTSTGLPLSQLGMPPEGVNPPAHTPAADFASSGMRPAQPETDASRQVDFPTKHGKLESGVPPSVAPVDGWLPGLSSAGTALERTDPAATVRFAGGMPVQPATGSPTKAAGPDSPGQAALPETNSETVPTARPEAGDAPAGAGSFPAAAFDPNVGRSDRIPIDTPGFTRKDPDRGLDLAPFSAADANMNTHPILAATMIAADPTSAVDRFEVFRRSRLRFSRLSQTETVGSIPNRAKRAGRPFSFLAAEQRIPADREPAGRKRMVDLAATAALAPAKGSPATGT